VAYLLLACAIAAEVVATSLLGHTNGFTVLLPSVVVLAGYAVSFFLLSIVVKTMPVGIAYAIWSGVGTLAVVGIGVTLLGQPLTVWQVVGVVLVVVGVVLINVGGPVH
jgi:small multidrug resistance pump